MRYFVVSDIHSHYDELIKALNEAKFDINNDNHILISLGDVWDRGSQSILVMNFILSLLDKKRCILIKGNHDDFIIDMIKRNHLIDRDYRYGIFETFNELANYTLNKNVNREYILTNFESVVKKIRKNKNITRLLNSMINYYELGDYVFVHGFIPIDLNYGYPMYKLKWKEANENEWYKARFYNGIELCSEYNIKIPNKTIVVGHYHCSYGNIRLENGFNIDNNKANKLEFSDLKYFKPYYNDGIIAIDACVYETKMINCLILDID